MTQTFWFGVARSKSLNDMSTNAAWWCLPATAAMGDRIFLYRPRSTGMVKHGIFAEAILCTAPNACRNKNYLCGGYGNQSSGKLSYVDIEIFQRFPILLTAKQMKLDPILSTSTLVQRNFQGTTFRLEVAVYERMKSLLTEINT